MSSPESAQSNPSQPASPAPASKPPRSPVERMLVWGGIIVLLVLVGIQARARLGYTMTLNALQDRIAEDEGPNPRTFPAKDVDQYLVGWPKQTRQEAGKDSGTIQLSWRGLTTSYEIRVHYDSLPGEPESLVTSLETKDAPTVEQQVADAMEEAGPTGTPSMPPSGMMGGAPPGGPPGMHGAGGPPGGGRDPMANDADGDGKLSREEAQGRLQENFDAADTDSDGLLTLEEITAWREANPRPQRDGEDAAPAGDAAAPADSPTSDDSSPAETTPPGESGASEAESSNPTPDESGATPEEAPAPTADEPAAESPESPAADTPQ